MKKILFAKILCAALLFTGCANQESTVTTAAKAATEAILDHVPQAARTPVANELDVGAVAIRSLKGKLSASELTDKITAFFPQSIRDQYPQIISMLVPVVVFAYQTQGEVCFQYIANGIEQGASTYITKH